MKTGSHTSREVTVDRESGVSPHPLMSQPFLAQNLSLAPILYTVLPSGLPVVHKALDNLLPFLFCTFPLPQPFSQQTFCPSTVPSRFWPLGTAVVQSPPSGLHRLCKPKSTERPPHTTKSEPLALASCPSCLLCLGIA